MVLRHTAQFIVEYMPKPWRLYLNWSQPFPPTQNTYEQQPWYDNRIQLYNHFDDTLFRMDHKQLPDIVMTDTQSNSIILLELTCPDYCNVDEDHKLKTTKYQALVEQLKDQWKHVYLICYEVCWRGIKHTIKPALDQICKIQNWPMKKITNKYMGSIQLDLSLIALEYSRAIWMTYHHENPVFSLAAKPLGFSQEFVIHDYRNYHPSYSPPQQRQLGDTTSDHETK
jgi:hypothetical protein